MYFRLKATRENRIIGSVESAITPALYFPAYFGKKSVQQGEYILPFNATLGPSSLGGYRANNGPYLTKSTVNLRYGVYAQDNMAVSGCYNDYWPKNYTNSMTIKANAKSSCNIGVTQHINFGKAFDLSKVQPQQGLISARCNAGTKYQIGIGSSSNLPNTGDRRAMKRDYNSNFVYYNLYIDAAYTRIWANKWNTDSVQKGAGNGTEQRYPVYAKLSQISPPRPPAPIAILSLLKYAWIIESSPAFTNRRPQYLLSLSLP